MSSAGEVEFALFRFEVYVAAFGDRKVSREGNRSRSIKKSAEFAKDLVHD